MSKRFFQVLLLTFALTFFLPAAYAEAGGLPADNFLFKQLNLIADFSSLQNDEDSNGKSSEIIKNFASTAPENAENDNLEFLTAFVNLAFSESSDAAIKTRRALQLTGHLQFHRQKNTQQKHHGPFAEHVVEAININRQRAVYYAGLSQGQTESLSRLYTSLEYAILPVAKIMDRLATKYQKAGIPVLVNDFVSMDGIAPANQPLLRTGALNKTGLKLFKKILSDYRRETFSAAMKKDFAMVKFYAVKGLSDLRHLEKTFNCNLALCIHLIESIGLAARNAAELSRITNGRTDGFYRAFIVLQNAGISGFSRVDVKAQAFHQHGIGIIVNDLPAIPFP